MYLTLSFVEMPAVNNIYNIYKNTNSLLPQRHTTRRITFANDENQNYSSSFHLGFNPGQGGPQQGSTLRRSNRKLLWLSLQSWNLFQVNLEGIIYIVNGIAHIFKSLNCLYNSSKEEFFDQDIFFKNKSILNNFWQKFLQKFWW